MIKQMTTMITLAVMLTGSTVAFAHDKMNSDTKKTAQTEVASAPLWLTTCSNQQQPDKLLCEVSQSIVLRQGSQSQRVATASVTRVAGQSGTRVVFTLPLGVKLSEYARILIDDKQVGTLTWQSCDGGGCYADSMVDTTWLKAMRSGKTMTVRLKGQDGRELSFSFQLAGISKAEDMLPSVR